MVQKKFMMGSINKKKNMWEVGAQEIVRLQIQNILAESAIFGLLLALRVTFWCVSPEALKNPKEQ